MPAPPWLNHKVSWIKAELQMMGTKTGVDERDLTALG